MGIGILDHRSTAQSSLTLSMTSPKALYTKPWCLVSPGSRGIGLALVRHLLRTTRAPVVATMRKISPAQVMRDEQIREECLTDLHGEDYEDANARLHIIETDVRSRFMAPAQEKNLI